MEPPANCASNLSSLPANASGFCIIIHLSQALFNITSLIMHSAQILAAVAALIPSSFAAPAPAPVIVPLVAAGPNLPQGGFTVGQIANGITIRNGALEVQKTFQKFAKPVPIHVAIAASSASAAATGSKAVATNGVQSGSVGATPSDSYDSEYVCPVQIGSNGQTVLLDFDTGSSDL